jgi:hypothetical protein
VTSATQLRLRDLDARILWPLWIALGYALFVESQASFAVLHTLGGDAHAYWLTGHRDHLYVGGPMTQDAYLYSPAFAQLIWPLTQLPWPMFCTVWLTGLTIAYAWLLRPLPGPWAFTALLACGVAVVQGNITAFLAVALVFAASRPGSWMLAALTKITICLGPFWFAARREWNKLAVALGATAVVAAVSLALNPSAWSDWFTLVIHARGDPSLPFRLATGIGLTIVAARRGSLWLLAPAMIITTPVVLGVVPYLSLLAAIPRLLRVEKP